jgi:esterase/lipase superfamily enzyme
MAIEQARKHAAKMEKAMADAEERAQAKAKADAGAMKKAKAASRKAAEAKPPPLSVPMPPFQDPEIVVPMLETSTRSYNYVPVFYGTDRKRIRLMSDYHEALRQANNSHVVLYNHEHSELEMGMVLVSVPKMKRAKGNAIPEPVEGVAKSPEEHFMIRTVDLLTTNGFLKNVNHIVTNKAQSEVFIFVHGYNVSFSQAIMRAAQLKVDWEFPGVAMVYSWPAYARLDAYAHDQELNYLSEANFYHFLKDVVLRTKASRIHVIAHSMGSRLLSNVLTRLAKENSVRLLDEVVMAAPDINQRIFTRDILPDIARIASRVTVYVSERDSALNASRKVHFYPRAGQGGEDMIVHRSIQTIDASELSTNIVGDIWRRSFGHSYYAEAKEMLDDMKSLLQTTKTPSQRGLVAETKDGIVYWRLRKAPK